MPRRNRRKRQEFRFKGKKRPRGWHRSIGAKETAPAVAWLERNRAA
jgi:hypothetical protein